MKQGSAVIRSITLLLLAALFRRFLRTAAAGGGTALFGRVRVEQPAGALFHLSLL